MLITQGSLVRAQLDPPKIPMSGEKDPGGLAQLGEHLLCKQGVVGSIPSSSTKKDGAGRCYNRWLSRCEAQADQKQSKSEKTKFNIKAV